MQFSRPRGTRDFLPGEMIKRRYVEGVVRKIFERYGYKEVQTPVFEELSLITRKSGDEIRERLYDFKDKSGRELALRPELTAPAMRLYVNEMQFYSKPIRLYYFGNCFRYERPQSGRYREFWQAGVELIGSDAPEADGEIIAVAVDVLKSLELKNFELRIGNIGIIRKMLRSSGISESEQDRIINAVDRGESIEELLKKAGVEGDKIPRFMKLAGERRRVIRDAELLLKGAEILEDIKKFDEMLDLMESYGIKDYTVDFGIARGLEYYTGMVFEIYADKLGAQKQICGGGTYSLADVFGGSKISTRGFAFGFDRLMLALEAEGKLKSEGDGRVLVVPTGEKMVGDAIRVASVIRKNRPCELELMRKKLGKALAYADAEGIPFVFIVGEDELAEGAILLRNMKTGEQRKMKIDELEKWRQ
ncbi:MAG: histidine--tRNA ligase [Candidatus Hydrothermarchaeaceae archaeon]